MLVLVVAAALLHWPSVLSLWKRWQPDPSYSHGWLIFAISAWLIWREARAGRLAEGRPHWLGVAAIPVLGAAWLLAMAGSIGIVQWLLLPAFMFAVAFALYGWTALRRLWFPIGFTLFAIPLWDPVVPVLQAITVKVVGVAIMALHIPALLIGNRVDLPSGSFEIVEGCSGAHFFMVSATLAALYGWLWYQRLKPTVGLLAVSLAVAMVANWLRVFLVIYAGYLTEMQHFLVQVDHYYFGWFMYMIMMAPVFVLARRWEPQASQGEAEGGLASLPQGDDRGQAAFGRFGAHFGAALAALAIAPAAWVLLNLSEPRPGPEALPPGQAGWELLGTARPDWQPRYRNADVTLDGAYWRDGRAVDTWIIYYARPGQGSEVANQSNRLASRGDGSLRRLDRPNAADTGPQDHGTGASLGEARLESGGGARLIRYAHRIGGRESTSALQAKWHQIVGTLSGQPEGALLAFSATCGADCDQARALLAEFEQDMGDALRAAIDGQGAASGQRGDEARQ
jgi:exosortase A